MDCKDIPSRTVSSIPEFIQAVARDATEWEPTFPWFRGEPASAPTPLVPLVFRPPPCQYKHSEPNRAGFHFDENNLLQSFRRRAHLLELPIIPQRDDIDLWLFLARHVGLPTRLLDWSEGALIGLYFALLEEDPVVWMLNPYELNRKSAPDGQPNVFPLTWLHTQQPRNIASINIAAAWQLGEGALDLPVAIEPTNIHPRMNAQHSYFTVHGKDRRPLCEQVGRSCLKRFEVRFDDPGAAIRELRRLGIARSTIMPDAEALAMELSQFMAVPD